MAGFPLSFFLSFFLVSVSPQFSQDCNLHFEGELIDESLLASVFSSLLLTVFSLLFYFQLLQLPLFALLISDCASLSICLNPLNIISSS